MILGEAFFVRLSLLFGKRYLIHLNYFSLEGCRFRRTNHHVCMKRFYDRLAGLMLRLCPNLQHLQMHYNVLDHLNDSESNWTRLCPRLKGLNISAAKHFAYLPDFEPLNQLEKLVVRREMTFIRSLQHHTRNLTQLSCSISDENIFRCPFPKVNHLTELNIEIEKCDHKTNATCCKPFEKASDAHCTFFPSRPVCVATK